MKELDRDRPMESVHKKTGEIGRVETVYQSKALTAGCGRMDGCTAYFDKYGQPKDDFCPWVVRNVEAAKLDWSKQIEAVHETGAVKPATLRETATRTGCAPLREVKYGILTDETRWFGDDGDGGDSGWRIRNTQSYTDAVSQLAEEAELRRNGFDTDNWRQAAGQAIKIDRALWERVEGLVRWCAIVTGQYMPADLLTEARSIVALLPAVEVDGDLLAAREVAASMYDNGRNELLAKNVRDGLRDDGMDVSIALAAIRKGRELEAGR